MCLPRFPNRGCDWLEHAAPLSAAPPPAGLVWSWYAGGAPRAVAGGAGRAARAALFEGPAGSYARGHRRPYKVDLRLPSPPGILQDSRGCAGYGP